MKSKEKQHKKFIAYDSDNIYQEKYPKISVICYSNLKHFFKNTTCNVNDLKTEATYSLKRACQDIT
jgi:hypothetical protein